MAEDSLSDGLDAGGHGSYVPRAVQVHESLVVDFQRNRFQNHLQEFQMHMVSRVRMNEQRVIRELVVPSRVVLVLVRCPQVNKMIGNRSRNV